MLDTLELQMPIFIRMAEEVRLDVTRVPNTKYAFECVKTQGAWMIWSQAYSLGVRDGQKQIWELNK